MVFDIDQDWICSSEKGFKKLFLCAISYSAKWPNGTYHRARNNKYINGNGWLTLRERIHFPSQPNWFILNGKWSFERLESRKWGSGRSVTQSKNMFRIGIQHIYSRKQIHRSLIFSSLFVFTSKSKTNFRNFLFRWCSYFSIALSIRSVKKSQNTQRSTWASVRLGAQAWGK